MALIDISSRGFASALNVFNGSVITFNGVSKPCIAGPIPFTKQQPLQGYNIDSVTSVVMLRSDFESFDGLKERVSKVRVNNGREMIYMNFGDHPNSATLTVHLQAP